MPACIYCREPLPNSVPSEHVIPQSFGMFDDNLTLHCVCGSCNRFFGGTLERALQLKSIEGVLRLQYGLADGTLGGFKSLEFKVADEGPWKGVRVKIKADKRKKTVKAVLIPQVGAHCSATDEWEWYTPEEITPEFARKYPKGSSSEIQVVVSSLEEQKGLIRILKENGVDFHPKRQMSPPFGPDGKVGTNLVGLFSEQIQRCIAKVAFNYLAMLRGAEFVLHPDFDAVRAYIRYGTEPRVKAVRPLKGSFLLEERHGQVMTRGHILRVDWSADKQSVVAQIAFFNTMKYTVVLCNRYSGVWTQDLSQGHHFDLDKHRIEPLQRTGLAIPVLLVPARFSPITRSWARRTRRVV
jgi:HNH endonuclease